MDYTVERIPGHVVVDPHGGDHGQGHRRKQQKEYGKDTAGQAEQSGDCVEISPEARRRAEVESWRAYYENAESAEAPAEKAKDQPAAEDGSAS